MTETAAHMSHTLTTAETHYEVYGALELTRGAFSCAGCLPAACTGTRTALSRRQADALNAAPAKMAHEVKVNMAILQSFFRISKFIRCCKFSFVG